MGFGGWWWRAGVVCAVVAAGAARAGESWDGGSLVNSNWSTAENWNPDGVPANNGTANIRMVGPGRTDANVDAPWSINSLTFDSGSLGFVMGGSALTVGGGAIKNLSGV